MTAPATLPDTDTDRFPPLPGWDGSDGGGRVVGIEIEFGNLEEGAAARVAQDYLGGTLTEAEVAWHLTDSALGALDIYLDTSWRDKLGPLGLDAGRLVIPVEIVTEPLPQRLLPKVEGLFDRLHAAGVTGTQDGMLLGFGLHLNLGLADAKGADLPAVGRAFAFLETWLRDRDPIDISRRLLPFTDRYPSAFLDALSDTDAPPAAPRFCELYLQHTPTRNRGLDLLPALRHLFPDAVAAALSTPQKVSARPAYHYRLPDSRIGDPGWSLSREWHRWLLVERVARDTALGAALAGAWRRRGWAEGPIFGGWSGVVDRLLREAGQHPDAA